MIRSAIRSSPAVVIGLGLLLTGCGGSASTVSGAGTPSTTSSASAAVSASTAASPSAAATVSDARMEAFGVEPNWKVEIDGGTVIYTDGDGAAHPVTVTAGGAFSKGVDLTGTMQGKAFQITLTSGACSDSMSDTSYEMTAVLTLAGTAYRGCGRTR